jgi:LacI family transcriptional regulator
MADVAALVGVSQTTVSLVLNRIADARVSEDTIQRVRKAAEKLGYIHNARRAAADERSETPVIGFIVDEMSADPWMAMALAGARGKSAEHGLDIVTVVTNGDARAELSAVKTLSKLNLSGLIYGAIQTRSATVPSMLLSLPTVLLNCHVAGRGVTSVVPGEVVGGRSATQYLIDHGHRRIAIVMGEAWMDAAKDRLKGYRQALAAADIAFDETLVRPGNWEPSAGYEQTIALMRLAQPPTGIFCSSDMMALGCYEALRDLGLQVPADVSVVGYDDREIAQFLHPPLTTVLLPHHEMGALAVELLLEQISAPRKSPPQLKAECPLVVRKSAGPPPGMAATPAASG